MKILLINGPNLNLLGIREKGIYGNTSFESYFKTLQEKYSSIQLEYYQSNIEGELINKIHETGFIYNGIVINAGAYTHTSVAIRDAISGSPHMDPTKGQREVRGLKVGASEAEPFRTEFLISPNRHSLRSVELVISDSHDGIKAVASKVLKASS